MNTKRGFTELSLANVYFLEKISLIKGTWELFELYEMKEITKFFTQSIGEGGELNPQTDIDYTMIANEDDTNFIIVGVILSLVRIFCYLMTHKIPYYI